MGPKGKSDGFEWHQALAGNFKALVAHHLFDPLHFAIHLAKEHLLVHHKVGDERPARIGKCRRPILLEDHVGEPRKAVAAHRCRREGQRKHGRCCNTANDSSGANEVHRSAGGIQVLRNVEVPEFVKGLRLVGVGVCHGAFV